MSAGGVVMLLSWLSCCGSALWRYSSNSRNFRIFNTRSTINLEYDGTSFSEWSVPGTCTVKNKRSPKTELRCSSPGVHTIKPIVTGPDIEEERYISVDNSYICFMWYYKVINMVHNLTQTIIIWVYDPENADPEELQWNVNQPSVYSTLLSKLLASLGQKPMIHTTLKKRVYYPHKIMDQGSWHITIPMTRDDILVEIKGNQVALQDCFIADSQLLLTFPSLTIPEVPGFLPVCSPRGSQLMADWDACFPSSVVVVADMETFQTNDSFRTWTRLRVPPNILTDNERHSVSDVSLSQDGIFLLISNSLYIKSSREFKRLGKVNNLPNNGIVGITSRRWCWLNYLLKVQKKRSNIAVWTKHEVYLGYRFLKFVKVITTNELKSYLHLAPSSTLVIHNVEYTGHPLELAFLLEYCTTCTNLKQIFVVIYNEDTTYLMCKDFTLNISVNSFLIPHFIYSAVPELILWDKHRIYYSYNNLTDSGVLQTPTEFGNLSKLSHDSTIHDVFIDYIGNIVIKMENNIMFYFKADMRDAVKLHLWTSSTIKSLVSLDMSGQAYLIYVFQNASIQPQEYPLKLEVESVTFKTKEVCPYVAFECNISHTFYFLDKGDKLTIWAELVYPENTGLYIIVESYGPNILEKTEKIHYDIGFGHCTKTMTATFSHNLKYEAIDNYFKLQNENTGLILVQIRPSENGKTCPRTQKVFQIAVGCDTTKYIAIKGFKNEGCLQHDLFYIIEKSYLRHQPRKNLRVKYDWNKYGCPLKLDFRKTFHPLLQLYNKNGYVEDINVNFIVWEIHGRNDYSFSNTMEKSGCLHEAQTWKTMTELNKDLPLEDAWGPQNYKHCFSYSIGKPGDLNQPYEIINKSNYNHLVWPVDHAGMYVFSVKILDPNYSFCNLTATFAIETRGLIPSPSGYLVGALLFLLMLIVFSVLVLSYFHYMKIYRKYLYQPIKEHQGKQKAS